jgi:Mor family transcriptional regulator
MNALSASNLPGHLEPHWRAIQKEFGGCLIYIPVERTRSGKVADRNRIIRAEKLGGMTVKQLAKRHGLSTNRIYKILAIFTDEGR